MKKNSKIRFIAGATAILAAILCGVAAGVMVSITRDLPQIRELENFKPSAVTRIYSLEKTLLAELYTQRRDPVPINQIPAYLQKALIATEDRQFYEHSGIDIKGILRAVIHDLIAGEFVQGASTITQQLSKTLFLTRDKTIERKIKEAFLALQLERRYTKDEILELYLNQVYFGSGAYGVESAARTYFGKSVRQLDLAQCALIAALPKAPSVYSPLVNPALSVRRRDIVLKQMLDTGIIAPDQYEQAIHETYIAPQNQTNGTRAPYFADYVKNVLEKEIGAALLYKGGLTVFTTLSFPLQEFAEQASGRGINAVAERMAGNRIKDPDPQCALVALDIQTGGILAMVGGKDHRKSRYNRATDARRQPGSAFKPIVYAQAIEKGFEQNRLILDAPAAFKGSSPEDVWQPENFSNSYQGEMSLRKALTHSENLPAVRLMEKLGPAGVSAFARSLGIESALSNYLSLALGTSEVNLMELTAAYAVFANQGSYVRPYGITDVLGPDGLSIWRPKMEKRAVMSRTGAAIVTDMLQGVISEGTGKKAGVIHHPVAGKTGTTNQCRDATFIGYSPSIAAGVWVGNDQFTTLGPYETGAAAALPIWINFMQQALALRPYQFFDMPDNVVKVDIDPDTGKPLPQESGGVPALFRKSGAPAR